MSRRCQVCTHPDVKNINKELVKGCNIAQLARDYELSEESMRIHEKRHLPRQLRTGAEVVAKNHGVDIMLELNSLMDETRTILVDAKEKQHNGLALKAIQQLRGNLTLVAQIQSEIYKQSQSGLVDEKELEQFRQWQSERNDLGPQIKTLSDSDRDLLKRAAIIQISEMNITEFTEEPEFTEAPDPVAAPEQVHPSSPEQDAEPDEPKPTSTMRVRSVEPSYTFDPLTGAKSSPGMKRPRP